MRSGAGALREVLATCVLERLGSEESWLRAFWGGAESLKNLKFVVRVILCISCLQMSCFKVAIMSIISDQMPFVQKNAAQRFNATHYADFLRAYADKAVQTYNILFSLRMCYCCRLSVTVFFRGTMLSHAIRAMVRNVE